jgi:hypothetical protein
MANLTQEQLPQLFQVLQGEVKLFENGTLNTKMGNKVNFIDRTALRNYEGCYLGLYIPRYNHFLPQSDYR